MAYGGAIYSENTLTIRGCTFYENTALRGGNGGAVYFYASNKYLTLTGNVFYRNNAASYPVAHIVSGMVKPSYNVVDADFGTRQTTQCGWDAGEGDVQIKALPVSPVSFKLLYQSGAAGILSDPLPPDYPTEDFYGDAISGGGAAGAVQESTAHQSGYYYLGLSVNNSDRGSVTVNPLPDADGLYAADSPITITATPTSPYGFGYWLINGSPDTASGNPLSITLDDHTWVEALFTQTMDVYNFDDGPDSATTPGTLRNVLNNAQDGALITFSTATPGTTTIELTRYLTINTSRIRVIIEGSGVTLTRAASWTDVGSTSQLLYILPATAETIIRRVRFKNGLAENFGSAIQNSGILTLESCIFSNNTTTGGANGGAVYSRNTLTVRGCSFDGYAPQTRLSSSRAIYFDASDYTLTLTGNLFYGNPSTNYPVARINGTVIPSYNAVDVDFGPGTGQCGWNAGPGDTRINGLPVSPASFRLLSGSGAAGVLPSALPPSYPQTDFYGAAISGGGAAGAVQSTAANPGNYYLGLAANDVIKGSVAASPQPDADGLYPANTSVTITATSNTGWSLGYWRINEIPDMTSDNPLAIILNAHTRVEAVFMPAVYIFTDGPDAATTPGTLRYALTNAQDNDLIIFVGVDPGTTTVELQSVLPSLYTPVTIEGNGVILTRSASWTPGASSQLLYIRYNSGVTIRQVHFKNGLATNYGGAIRNVGTLTLESCIFSGNQVTGNGGAIYSESPLTIRGCTFYNNTVTDSSGGGALYFNGSNAALTLTGNLFYGNSAPDYPVARIVAGDVIPSYNVVDADYGTASDQAGWDAGTGDTTYADLGITGDPFDTTTFVPVAALESVIPSSPEDFPVTDFYGDTRTFPGAPGAVK
jgi:predicted outer membrane repeat protein